MTDEAAVQIEIGLGVEPARELVRGPELPHRDLPHPGHDPHVERDVDAVGQLDPHLAESRPLGAHQERDDVHRSPAHRAVVDGTELCVRLGRLHPVVRRARVVPVGTADEGQVLGAGDVVLGAPVEVAAGELLRIQSVEVSAGEGLLDEARSLFLRPIAPGDAFGLTQPGALLHPRRNRPVRGHVRSSPSVVLAPRLSGPGGSSPGVSCREEFTLLSTVRAWRPPGCWPYIADGRVAAEDQSHERVRVDQP